MKTLVSRKTTFVTALSALAVMLFAATAMAYTTPASGDLFYEAYDLVINSILAGPVGYIMAAFMFIGGILLLIQGKGFLMPMVCVIGAALIIKSDAIVGSFGYTMDASILPAVGSMTSFLL